ncbi:hypothetical protein ACISNL_08715, partial [Campylobacter jejuni]
MKSCLYFTFIVLFLTACSTKNLTSLHHENLEQKNENQHYAKLEYEQNVSILPQFTYNINFDVKRYKKHFFTPWHDSFKNYKGQNIYWSFHFSFSYKHIHAHSTDRKIVCILL